MSDSPKYYDCGALLEKTRLFKHFLYSLDRSDAGVLTGLL